jgi:cysteine desulfuration protein SufE
MFDDWMERYEYIIQLGKSLPLIKDEFKTDSNVIKGCQSKVWLQGENTMKNRFHFYSKFYRGF